MKQVSLYIHIPFCLSKCSYCDFFSIPENRGKDKSVVPENYVKALCNEIEYRLKKYGDCEIKSIYAGGGTPSLLSPEQITLLWNTLCKYRLADNLEYTFELNPDDVTKELLLVINNNGVTRLSLGVQSLSDDVLKSVHRRADSACIKQALETINQFWPGKISADLICGLPGETAASMKNALETLIQNNIPHISFYSLCVEDETPLGKKINSGEQNYDQDFSDSLWLEGRDYLLFKGYEQYEISNFCLPGFECIHNMTYWTHDDYIGVGSGAYGTVYSEQGKSLGTGLRINNTLDIHKYCDFWNSNNEILEEKNIPQQTEILDKQTSIFEYFMMGLRTKNGISTSSFKRKFNQELPENIIRKLEDWEKKGLCCLEKKQVVQGNGIIEDTRFYLNNEGMLFLNRFLEEL